MDAKGILKETYGLSAMVIQSYIGDLSDSELLTRPGKGCNHIAWQLGHLIDSECGLLNAVRPGSAPVLPAGFSEKHSKANSNSDNPSDFLTRHQYQELAKQVQDASYNVIDSFSAEELDAPSPDGYRQMFPTMGTMLVLIVTHWMMHAGQIVPVRRALNKPIVM